MGSDYWSYFQRGRPGSPTGTERPGLTEASLDATSALGFRTRDPGTVQDGTCAEDPGDAEAASGQFLTAEGQTTYARLYGSFNQERTLTLTKTATADPGSQDVTIPAFSYTVSPGRSLVAQDAFAPSRRRAWASRAPRARAPSASTRACPTSLPRRTTRT